MTMRYEEESLHRDLVRIAKALERGNKLKQLEVKNQMLGMTDAAIERELKEMQ